MSSMISVKQAADLLGLKRAIVYRYCQRGDLPSSRVGSVYVLDRDVVKQFAKIPRKLGPKPRQTAS